MNTLNEEARRRLRERVGEVDTPPETDQGDAADTELEWADPPAPSPRTAAARRNTATLFLLKQHPGRWARLRGGSATTWQRAGCETTIDTADLFVRWPPIGELFAETCNEHTVLNARLTALTAEVVDLRRHRAVSLRWYQESQLGGVLTADSDTVLDEWAADCTAQRLALGVDKPTEIP